ncbi:TPA: HNH endonuclease [Enterobacter asburiae]|nr:HNH endonuclease [Enterobacter asburiae]
MRHVSRGVEKPPKSLSALNSEDKSELDRAREYYATPGKKDSFLFKAYSKDDVKWRLNTLFHYKCAYCETYFPASSPVDVEHYRPKNSVSEDPDHPGYWWLAMRWDNLLPSCIDCNRNRRQHIVEESSSLEALQKNSRKPKSSGGKQDSFPLAAGGARMQPERDNYAVEKALLLNPCEHNPDEYIRFVSVGTPSLSLVVPVGELTNSHGAVSIHVYGLNRLGLVQDRTRYMRRLEFLGDSVISLGQIIDSVDAMPLTGEQKDVIHNPLIRLLEKTTEEMANMAKPEQPYSVMADTWIKSFYQRLE